MCNEPCEKSCEDCTDGAIDLLYLVDTAIADNGTTIPFVLTADNYSYEDEEEDTS